MLSLVRRFALATSNGDGFDDYVISAMAGDGPDNNRANAGEPVLSRKGREGGVVALRPDRPKSGDAGVGSISGGRAYRALGRHRRQWQTGCHRFVSGPLEGGRSTIEHSSRVAAVTEPETCCWAAASMAQIVMRPDIMHGHPIVPTAFTITIEGDLVAWNSRLCRVFLELSSGVPVCRGATCFLRCLVRHTIDTIRRGIYAL